MIITKVDEVRVKAVDFVALLAVLVAVLCTRPHSAWFAYFPDTWMRQTAISGSLITTYSWDGQNLLSQSVSNGVNPSVTTSNLHHGNTPLWEMGSQTGLQVYAHDPLGNVSGLVGNLGTLSNPSYGYSRTFAYDSFGQVLQEQMGQLGAGNQPTLATLAMGAGAPSSGLRYKGELFDGPINQSYMRNRQYEPMFGRFAQVDPARAGTNWYRTP